jgi:hypothetical protein
MEELNIVELIENNPITKLSNTYNNKLLNKIQEKFTGFEQQLFVSSFYCYLNYDKNIDFVVDLDNIWEWLGFNQKYNAVRLLEKHFKPDFDYKTTALQLGGAKQNGGQNKQIILLNIKCFKSLCLKAHTKKANEIHEYYMKMEEVLHETVEEETTELKLQLEEKNNVIIQKDITITNTIKDKQKAVEQATIVQFPLNTECIYFGTIDNTNELQEKLIKFGHTNDLSTRILVHRKNYNNFNLVNAFRVQNKVEIENLIKTYPKIKKQIRSIEVNGKNKTEIIAYDATNFTIDKLSKHVKDIIHSKTYSIDNFNKLMKENENLINEINLLKEHNLFIEKTLIQQINEITSLSEKLENNQKIVELVNNENKSLYQNVLLPEDEINTKIEEFIKEVCIVRPDVEDISVNIEGRFRLWNKVKPTKEMFHSLKNYMDIRFKPKRINGHHGYIGVKLKIPEYKKQFEKSIVETFIFQVCKFEDCGKILNTVLLREYKKWKISVGIELTDNDMKEIKEYLNLSDYALKSTVWTDEGSNEGYYGLSLKENIYKSNIISSTGKKVYKRELKTDQLLATWDTIAKASIMEGVSKATMSRSIKNKIVINNDYYYAII